MEQNEITKRSALLNSRGELNQRGWAVKPLLDYSRKDIKSPGFKIKEWDYYCILSDKNRNGISFTVADNGYLGFVAMTIFDFKNGTEESASIMTPFPLGSFKMPESSETGDIIIKNKKISMELRKNGETRTISVDYPGFGKGKGLSGSVSLHQGKNHDSMVIATPFSGNRKAFYYNQKINCMPSEGKFTSGERVVSFTKADSSAVLDWGRGVWTYSNTWYWGSASGQINDKPFGFNIGYGFSKPGEATENMLFYDGRAHKLDKVEFHIPEDNYLSPWEFSSSDSRFEMQFKPLVDRYSNTNIIIIQSDQHQVFGLFTGKAVLDTGEVIELKDFLGFAEKVKNRW